MARESELWRSLSNARYELRERLHMHRVENSATPGTPDVEGFLAGQGAFQFELKSAVRPKNPEHPVRFDMKKRERQIAYMTRRWLLGGACYWLLQVGAGHHRQIYMLAGDMGLRIRAGMTEDQLADNDYLKNPKWDPAEAIRRARRL